MAYARAERMSMGIKVDNQFNAGGSGAELPNYGAPDGWGIAQLDTPLGVSASTDEVYNWKTNAFKFLQELNEKQTFTTAYFNALKSVYQPQSKWEEPPSSYTPAGTSTSMTAQEASVITLYNGASWLVEVANGQIVYNGPYTSTSHGGSRYISCWQFSPDNPSGQKWNFVPNSNNYVYKVIHDEFESPGLPISE